LQAAQKPHTVNVDDTFVMGGENCWHGIDGSYADRVVLGGGQVGLLLLEIGSGGTLSFGAVCVC